MSKMRSLRLHGPRELRMHEESAPVPSAGQVQIQVRSVGICASDLHYYREGRIGTTVLTTPLVLGHEASGVVTALGEGVIGLAPGDRVAIEPAMPCMDCEFCRAGNYNVCPGIPFMGTPPTDGALRDYISWPAHLAVKMPESLSFDEIAMLEPMAIGVHAVKLAKPRRKDVGVVLGAGAVGLSVLQAAKAAGMSRVIVSEPVEARRMYALRLGASEVIDPTTSSPEHEVARLTDGRGADVVFECTGEDAAVRESCLVARPLGKVMILGIPDGDDYPFDASSARRKQLTAIFVRRSNQTLDESTGMVTSGKVDVACLATHRFPLEETAEAMELAISKTDGILRAIIAVSE
jgi:L-iditol 2-dehydrogenase